MKLSRFTTLMTLAVLMTVGFALMPRIDVAESARPRQGSTLCVTYAWPGASAKVVEQNVTSRIEGVVSAVRGIESVSSESYFGSGRIVIQLKKNADVSMARFEIASLLRQIKKLLPEGVCYPVLTGGEVVNENQRGETQQVLLSYLVHSNLSNDQLKEYMERQIVPVIRQMQHVQRVEVTGGRDKYIAISYDPFLLHSYGLSAIDLESGVMAFLGRSDVVGEVQQENEKHTLYLTTRMFEKPLERMPIGVVDGKSVYLGDMAAYEYCDRLPDSYYRVNGLNTIYLNILVDADANKIAQSRTLRKRMDALQEGMRQGVYLTLNYDGAEEQENELRSLLWRSSLSLLLLLVFVWLVRRDVRYLLVMAVTLAANLAMAVIAYYLFDIRLHIYSLAGITVSLGMVIDAAVVMVDHYSYYHDRKAFMAILAALLTTMGSLIVVLWLPDFLQQDLYDFAWIIIINLTVSLLVSWLFVPALIDSIGYHSRQNGRVRHQRLSLWWGECYIRYLRSTQRHKWICYVLLVLAFGIPFHALPPKWGAGHHQSTSASTVGSQPWFERVYNATLGSDFFQRDCKMPLSKVFGGSLRLFAESLKENGRNAKDPRVPCLTVRAQMPLGGTAAQLNEKVMMLENYLVTFPEIERFETRINNWGATVKVDFREEYQQTSFPYALENKVISKVITIGGADWSTSGVSERGFSNSLNLQQRNCRIDLTGYNYDRLYRMAEEMCAEMKKNKRVVDLTIVTPGHEYQEDELYMHYDKEKMALYQLSLASVHGTLRELLAGHDIARYHDANFASDVHIHSSWQNRFDVWHLQNSTLPQGLSADSGLDDNLYISDFMSIQRREAKGCIPRQNQEYVLRVAFNVLGSYTYTSEYIKRIVNQSNAQMPIGYKCRNSSAGFHADDGTQYGLLCLIAVIIFFICSILFESLRLPLAILSLIPVSFIGIFLTYWLTDVKFGTGGFASMVLLGGLTVNAGIYIVCEYRNQLSLHPNVAVLKNYTRAYNHKIPAVILTILSTILGLVPFLIDGTKEPFWFSFAVGSIGGLSFSLLALVFVMPTFFRLTPRNAVES